MKKVRSFFTCFLAVCISLGMLSVSIPARAASYSNNYLEWLQSQSSYETMRSGGCRVVSYAKLLRECMGGCPDSYDRYQFNGRPFNPDVLFEWCVQAKTVTSLSDVTELGEVGTTVVKFAREVLGMEASNEKVAISGSAAHKRQIMLDYCKNDYKVILVNGDHFVYVKEHNGELYAAGSGNGFTKVTEKADGYSLSNYNYIRVFKFKDILPKFSDIRVENITESGFDITYNVSLEDCLNLESVGAYVTFYADPNEVSYGWEDTSVKEVEIPTGCQFILDKAQPSDSTYSITGDRVKIHFDLVDDFDNYSYKSESFDENDKKIVNITGLANKLPKAGLTRMPYVNSVVVTFYPNFGKENKGNIMGDGYPLKEGELVVDLSSVIDEPTENKETTEPDTDKANTNTNTDTNSKDDAPVGNDKTPVYNPQPVETAPAFKPVGTIFNVAYRRYKVTGDGEVTLIGLDSKAKTVHTGDIIEIDGVTYKVTGVDSKALKGNKRITEIIIGEYVEEIGKAAFSGCKNLSLIKVKARHLRKMYKNSFSGTSKKMTVWVRYKDKLKKYRKLISKAGVSAKTTYTYKKFN